MLQITDFKTDDADDIIIGSDIEVERSYSLSTMKTAERRISGRYDDFLLDDCAAGIERFIQGQGAFSRTSVEYEIRKVLTLNNLFANQDYDIKMSSITNGKLFVGLRFKTNQIDTSDTFQIIVNLENQQSYR
jgi:fructose-1,6-bisphosphatase/sedoheptulose 1,7-bisphosphatase-like protein